MRLDLRPLHELLAPPFFADPAVLFTVRDGLRVAIARAVNEPTPYQLSPNDGLDMNQVLARARELEKQGQPETAEAKPASKPELEPYCGWYGKPPFCAGSCPSGMKQVDRVSCTTGYKVKCCNQ